jgi:hypothetical protein
MLIVNLLQNGQSGVLSKKMTNSNPFLVSEETPRGISRTPWFIIAKVKADGRWRNFVRSGGHFWRDRSHDEIIGILAKPADERIFCPSGCPIDLDTPDGAQMLSEAEQRLFGESAIQQYTELIRNEVEFIRNTAPTIEGTLDFHLAIGPNATMRGGSVDDERFWNFCDVGWVGCFHLGL